jgi:hypothetical protein
VSQDAGFSYADQVPGGPRWPLLAGRELDIGGVRVTYAQAAAAVAALAQAGGIMVRQVLDAAGSPLAGCDYLAAGKMYRELAEAELAAEDHHRGRGAAGLPVAKRAFMAALAHAMAACEAAEPARHFAAELAAAREAFSADAGYAASMARAAVALKERDHASSLRQQLAAAVHAALSACAARGGEFACAALSACGTGDCRLAPGALKDLTVPAPPGRVPRPANHVRAGTGFGTAAALRALEAAVPFTAALAGAARPSSADAAAARDQVAA